MHPRLLPVHRSPLLSLSSKSCFQYLPNRIAIKSQQCRYFSIKSSSPELLTIQDIPAAHIGHIRVIGLNSPHNRNALSKRLLAELSAEVRALKDADGSRGGTRVLILASEVDEAFCAGADLKERLGMTNEETKSYLTSLRTTFTDLSRLRIPTISAVSAVAAGGGFELALTTTLRVFSSSAKVGLPETRLGIIPGAGGTYRLKSLVGNSTAQQLVLTGRLIPGNEAYRMGICNYAVNCDHNTNTDWSTDRRVAPQVKGVNFKDGGYRRGQVLEVALNIAKDICHGAPVAVSAALSATRFGPMAERSAYHRCMIEGRLDRKEGLRAFREKRSPQYTGGADRNPRNVSYNPGTPEPAAEQLVDLEDPEGIAELDAPEEFQDLHVDEQVGSRL